MLFVADSEKGPMIAELHSPTDPIAAPVITFCNWDEMKKFGEFVVRAVDNALAIEMNTEGIMYEVEEMFIDFKRRHQNQTDGSSAEDSEQAGSVSTPESQ